MNSDRLTDNFLLLQSNFEPPPDPFPQWWAWGLGWIEAIQSWGPPWLDHLMRGITALGSEEFYFFCVVVLLWTGCRRTALVSVALLSVSSTVNANLKEFFGHPRPFDLVPDVQLVFSRGYGFPSGHAQNAVLLWGLWGRLQPRRMALPAAALMILLISFSRIYLGVHFPTDVLAGWLVGLLLAAAALAAQNSGRLDSIERSKIALVLIQPAGLIWLYLVPLETTARLLGLLCGVVVGEFSGSGARLTQPTVFKVLAAFFSLTLYGVLKWVISPAGLLGGFSGMLLTWLVFWGLGYLMALWSPRVQE